MRPLSSPPFVPFICARMWGRGVPPAALPAPLSTTLSLALSTYLHECGAAGSASGQTACPVRPTLHQSWSRHGLASPLLPGCPSPPLLPVSMYVYFLFPWCRTSLPLDILSVLVVRGGTGCLPTPPSWFSPFQHFLNQNICIQKCQGLYIQEKILTVYAQQESEKAMLWQAPSLLWFYRG